MVKWIADFFRKVCPKRRAPSQAPGPWLMRLTGNTVWPSFDEPAPLPAPSQGAIWQARALCSDRARSLRQETVEFEESIRRIANPKELALYTERQRRSLFLQKQALRSLKEITSAAPDKACDPAAAALFKAKLNRPVDALGGYTLLTFFASARDFLICEALIALGADPEAPNENGASALDIARARAQSLDYSDESILQNKLCAETCAILALLERRSLEGRAGPDKSRQPPCSL